MAEISYDDISLAEEYRAVRVSLPFWFVVVSVH